MSIERAFEGIWIPSSIWMNKSLTITEKVMYVEICSLGRTQRGCWATNAYFSEFFDLSKSRVSEIISSLVAKGMVTSVVERDPVTQAITKRTLRPSEKAMGYSENTDTPIRKTEDPYSEKAQGNSTKSSSTESIEESGASPDEQKKRRQSKSRKQELTLTEWVKSQPKGVELIGPEHPARVFAAQAGIPDGWVALAWKAFTDKHKHSDKRYKDWGLAFRNAVAGNWEKVWYVAEDGQWKLTTVGHGLDRVMNRSGA